jgi:activator of HSP90 ATPase
MRSLIMQSIVLPAPAETLYAMYLDPARHAAITGAPVIISAASGSEFHAFEGRLSGTMLSALPSRLVVQSWRSMKFNDDDPDSTLILAFLPEGTAGRIDLLHLDVPAHDHQGVTEGWETHYWEPWRRYLARP